MGPEVAQHHGVAVRRRARDPRGADRAARPGHVLDHDLLAERLAHVLAENARQHVGRPAGRERHDHGDGPGGPGLLGGGW
jgi:hypothetical protein